MFGKIDTQAPQPEVQEEPINEALQARLTMVKALLPQKVFLGIYNEQVLCEFTDDGPWFIAQTNELEARAWAKTVHADAELEANDLRTILEDAIKSNAAGVLLNPQSNSPIFFSTSEYQLILNEPGGKFAHLLDNQVYVVVKNQGSGTVLTLCTQQLPEGKVLLPVFEEASWGIEWILNYGVPGEDTIEHMTLRDACNQALSHPSEIYFIWYYATQERHQNIRLSEYQQLIQRQSQAQQQPPNEGSPAEPATESIEDTGGEGPNVANLLLEGEEKALVEYLIPLPNRLEPERSLAKLYGILLQHAVLAVAKVEGPEAEARKEDGKAGYESRNLVYFKHPKSGNRFLTIFSSMEKAHSFLSQLSPQEKQQLELIAYPFAGFCKRAEGTVSYVTLDIGNEAYLLIQSTDLTYLAKGEIPAHLLLAIGEQTPG